MAGSSASTAPPLLLEGIEQFNNGEFFECHETLENIWMPAEGELRVFYQGLIQIAVAFVHVQRGNHRGAVTMLRRALEKVRQSSPKQQGIDVATLVAESERCLAEIESLGAERIREFDPNLLPTIRFTAGGKSPSP